MNDKEYPILDIAVDASAILAAYFPDEEIPQALRLMEDYALGRVNLWAPRLLILELINACLTAKKRNRIDEAHLDDLVGQFLALDIHWIDVEESAHQVFWLSKEHSLTAYDAAYVAAAQVKGYRLITGDKKLHETVNGKLPFVVLLEDYQGAEEYLT
ncbi:MAG: type II toxin-antitoxin system VapC family toxin [Thermoanaerobacteraceae bacterium]|nr:type II toxin-antitoxin system VapC family toxin [Thermoanaerobacteraceae bacterium]